MENFSLLQGPAGPGLSFIHRSPLHPCSANHPVPPGQPWSEDKPGSSSSTSWAHLGSRPAIHLALRGAGQGLPAPRAPIPRARGGGREVVRGRGRDSGALCLCSHTKPLEAKPGNHHSLGPSLCSPNPPPHTHTGSRCRVNGTPGAGGLPRHSNQEQDNDAWQRWTGAPEPDFTLCLLSLLSSEFLSGDYLPKEA